MRVTSSTQDPPQPEFLRSSDVQYYYANDFGEFLQREPRRNIFCAFFLLSKNLLQRVVLCTVEMWRCCRRFRRKSHTQLDVVFSEKRSTEAALGFFLSFHVNNISPPYLPPYSSHRTIPIPPRNSSRYTIYCLTIIEGMKQVPINPQAIEFRLYSSAKVMLLLLSGQYKMCRL